MAQVKEMASVVECLRQCSTLLSDAADSLEAIFSNTIHSEQEQKAEEAKPKAPTDDEVTFEMLRGLLTQKSTEDHREEVKALINAFGAIKLSDVKPEDYAAMYAKAKVIGNA